jgi:hypothetical protein
MQGERMDPTLVTAVATALGSAVGAAASIATTWLTQRTQALRASAEWKLREREALYREFITEASRAALDALMHSLDRPEQMIGLYGILSRIRLLSGDEIVRQGEDCCRRIVELYGQPNLTTDQIRTAIERDEFDKLDPLKQFSNACRDELLATLRK